MFAPLTNLSVRLTSALSVLALSVLALSVPLLHGESHASPRDDADLIVLDGGMAQVTMTGLLQLQATPFLGADASLAGGDAADSDGFRLHRARFGLTAHAWGNTEFTMSFQASTLGFNVLDAYVAYRDLNFLSVVVGSRISPFSRFAQTDVHRTSLTEMPFAARSMAPFRQVGLTLEGEVGEGLFKYAAGVYNGMNMAPNFLNGYDQSPSLEGEGVSVVGRAELAPLGSVGGSMVDFDRKGLRVGIGGAAYYNSSSILDAFGWEVDLVLKYEGLHFAFEYLADSFEAGGAPAVDRQALVAELGYLLYEDVLGATVRFEWLEDSRISADDGMIVFTGGLQYYLHRQHLKFQLEYTHRAELGGLVGLDNDALVLQVQMAL